MQLAVHSLPVKVKVRCWMGFLQVFIADSDPTNKNLSCDQNRNRDEILQ